MDSYDNSKTPLWARTAAELQFSITTPNLKVDLTLRRWCFSWDCGLQTKKRVAAESIPGRRSRVATIKIFWAHGWIKVLGIYFGAGLYYEPVQKV